MNGLGASSPSTLEGSKALKAVQDEDMYQSVRVLSKYGT